MRALFWRLTPVQLREAGRQRVERDRLCLDPRAMAGDDPRLAELWGYRPFRRLGSEVEDAEQPLFAFATDKGQHVAFGREERDGAADQRRVRAAERQRLQRIRQH